MQAKKSLGQNWLKSSSAIKEIIKTADLKSDDLVLEIGPGRGALTEQILASGCRVVAVEKDHRLMEFLETKFASEIAEKKLVLIHDDILNLDFNSFLNSTTYNLPTTNYKLIANIPYYITGQIIRKFLSEPARNASQSDAGGEKIQPSSMVLMLQKEVAKRIVASDKKESLLSLSVKVYGEPKYIKTIPAGAFEPKPKVDSAILLIKNISRNFFSSTKLGTSKDISEDKFFEIIKTGFGQKRKQLKGNLGISAEILTACNLSEKIRAEDLNLENWRCLIDKIKN